MFDVVALTLISERSPLIYICCIDSTLVSCYVGESVGEPRGVGRLLEPRPHHQDRGGHVSQSQVITGHHWSALYFQGSPCWK